MKSLVIGAKTWTADYAGIGYMGMLKAQIHDKRNISIIAPEIEGAATIILTEDGRQEYTQFDNYTQIVRIERIDENSVCILLARPEVHNGGV